VFPLFLFVMLGIMDFGLLFQRYQVVTNAAREGARVAVLPGYDADDVSTRVEQYLEAAGLDPDAATIAPDNEAVPVGEQCISVQQVTVTYPHAFSFVGGIAGLFGDALGASELQVTSEMRSELAAIASCAGS
jgi:Flp pilus assembly protein TadG